MRQYPVYQGVIMLPQEQNHFEFRKQFAKLVGAAFRVYDASQQLILFSEQKGWKVREDIRVYSDESKANKVLSIKTQKNLDISATYDIVDTATGQHIGSL